MAEKFDPKLRLRIALDDLSPEEDPDDFTELVAAMLEQMPAESWRSELRASIAHQFDLAPNVVRDWASGATTPTPKFRRVVVKYLRSRAAELLGGQKGA